MSSSYSSKSIHTRLRKIMISQKWERKEDKGASTWDVFTIFVEKPSSGRRTLTLIFPFRASPPLEAENPGKACRTRFLLGQAYGYAYSSLGVGPRTKGGLLKPGSTSEGFANTSNPCAPSHPWERLNLMR